jgi:hypothetical protein
MMKLWTLLFVIMPFASASISDVKSNSGNELVDAMVDTYLSQILMNKLDQIQNDEENSQRNSRIPQKRAKIFIPTLF